MTTKSAARRPAIHMIDSEADRLAELAVQVMPRLPQVAALLTQEIDRAHIHAPADMPAGGVTMMATVEFIDETSGATRTVQLVWPADADIAAGRVSILTPVGAGLIGLAAGQSINWPDREGQTHRLTIRRVSPPGAA